MKENTTWLHIRATITFVSLICLTLFIAMVAISKEPVVIRTCRLRHSDGMRH